MAFTRRFLSALGIEADKIDEIITAHIEVVDGLKEERDNYKKDAEKLVDVQKQLNEANEKLAKNGEGETVLKSEYDAIKNEFDEYKNSVEAEKKHTAKEHAFRELLRAAGVSEKRINAVLKVSDIDGVELDENGKIKDEQTKIEAVKSEWSEFIETTTTKGAQTATPPANSGRGTGKTKDEILAIKDGAVRRQEMLNNPELFGLGAK